MEYKLGEIADIITGPFGSALHQYEYVKNGVPVIMPQDIGDRYLCRDKIAFITDTKAKELSRYITKENDIVYARRGDVEKHAFIQKDDAGAICGTGCLRVRVKSGKCNPMFISFYLNRLETKKWITQHAVGSNMPNINSDILSKVPLMLPDIGVQDRVADVLSSLDEKIQNNNKIGAELEAMAKTLYDYWFVQFDFPDADGRPYRTSGGAMVWNYELKREVPEGWGVVKLNDILSEAGCPTQPDNSISHLPYTPIDEIPKKKMTFAGGLSANFANSSLQLYEENDILLGAMRVYFHRVCIAAQKGITRSTTIVLKSRKQRQMPFLYQLLNMDATIQYATKISVGTQQPYVNWDDALDRYDVLFPPDNLIEMYCDITLPIIESVKQKAHENQTLAVLRDWLLPILMNGQARVE